MTVPRYLLLIIILLFFPQARAAAATDLVTLTGTITDTEGLPVEGAEVYLYDSDNIRRPGDYISNRTLADGRYRIVVSPGTFWAVARKRVDDARFGPLSAKDKHSGEPEKIDLAPSANLSIDFTVRTLQEAALLHNKRRDDLFKITGRIIDKSGQGIPQVYAMASNSLKTTVQIPEYLSTWTGESGNFVLYLPEGVFRIGAAQSFPPDTACRLDQEISVTEDQDAVILQAICEKP